MDCIKHLILPHAANLRDMGGLQTQDGHFIRWHRLYRADALSALTPDEWETLYARGIRTVVDLRSRSETVSMPDRVPDGILWVHCPLQTEQLDLAHLDEGAAAAFRRSMAESYTDILDKTPQLLAAAVQTVADRLAEGAVLFHCTAGKDRTGVLAATLLHILGAYDADILAEYEVSATLNRAGLQKIVAQMPNYEEILPLLSSARENMEPLLARFHTMDLESHLCKNGLSETAFGVLRTALRQ